eukprot:gb/GEZN01013267.1/.p2 GENE.gb/GEZN01013267.1/~~gb/GEZN01013267.1/.p2  ORF type:complete len:308 (+),score=60.51 gb/GEZN01013267.1/:38-961(+)
MLMKKRASRPRIGLHILLCLLSAFLAALLVLEGLAFYTAGSPSSLGAGGGVVDVLLGFQPNHERRHVDHSLPDTNVPLANHHTGMVDALGQKKRMHASLQTAFQKFVNCKTQTIVELLLRLAQETQPSEAAQKSSTTREKMAKGKKEGGEKKTKKEGTKKAKGEKKAAVKTAKKAAVALKKGVNAKNVRKIRTTVHFTKPKTKELKRNGKYPKRSVPRRNKMDKYAVVKYPLCTESAMKQIEDNNTLTFIVDIRANKRQIAQSVKALYEIDVAKTNTLIRPDGQKKAYVRLTPDHEALEVANTIGII